MSSQFNTLSLSDTRQSKLLKLNHSSTIDTETYININNYYQIGSVNCNFVIKRDNEELLVIDDSNITFNVNIDLNKINVNNEAILYDAIIENDLLINTSNVNINNDIILSSNIIDINKTTYFNSNIHTNTLYVDTIDNILGCNIIINNLELNQSVFDNPKLLNSVNIIRDTLDSSNIINININNNSNLENILKVADTITINKNGEINIKENININSNSIYLPALSIDNKNHLTIGDTKNPVNVVDYDTKIEWNSNNNSLLHIHRKDTYKEYDIIKDPLLYITVDYEPNCNIIKTNYDQTELIFSNLELTLSSNITIENHIIYLDLLPPVQNAIWSSNTIPLVINPVANDQFLNTSINLYLTDYDYNNYNIFANECKSTSVEEVDGITTYTMNVYIGFYKTEDIKLIILEKTDEHKAGKGYDIEYNLIGCNIGYCNIIEDNYSPYNIPEEGSGSIIINFTIHILYEESDDTEVMYYINTNPIIIECPLIMHCEFSNNDILTLNSNGLLRIKDLNTLKATIPDLTISNIHTDVSFKNNNITNVNNLELNNITVDTIDATTITTTNIYIEGGQTIQFTEIDTSNFNSAFFKYNDTRTNFFNEVTLCEGQIEYELIEDYRSNNDISGFLISSLNKLSNINTINEDIAYFDGNVKIIGELQIDNINTNNTLNIKDHIRITDNVISLGDYVETLTNKNKIWFGNYSNLLDYDQDEDTIDYTFDTVVIYDTGLAVDFNIYKNYYNYFTTFYSNLDTTRNKIKEYANEYNINMFGNVRVATINNETILELSDYTDIHSIPKNTMNVYGNIKCCKSFKFEEGNNTATILSDTALTANGNIEIDGEINTTSNINCVGNIISIGSISTNAHIEAKKGVRNISDSRVKYDLKKIENAVNKLKSLSGYTFKRKDLNGIKDTGLLAQDVRSVLPEVVNENDEGILSIEYSKMMGLIVEAIKELNAKIDLIK
tara:strand:+ start:6385 stop:9255 length:2871 start_codon:yes stop_codon:yes gene_type:complete